jgi:RNA polymerase sigma factor (sigma-70 family)
MKLHQPVCDSCGMLAEPMRNEAYAETLARQHSCVIPSPRHSAEEGTELRLMQDVVRSALNGLMRRYGIPRSELDELKQECWVAVTLVFQETDMRSKPYLIRATQYRVIDVLRRHGPLTRRQSLENRADREAGREVTHHTPFSLEEMAEVDESRMRRMDLPYEEPGYERIENQVTAKQVWDLVERNLDSRYKLVLTLYYREKWTLARIGDLLDITESRVCQMVKSITINARALLADADRLALVTTSATE